MKSSSQIILLEIPMIVWSLTAIVSDVHSLLLHQILQCLASFNALLQSAAKLALIPWVIEQN